MTTEQQTKHEAVSEQAGPVTAGDRFGMLTALQEIEKRGGHHTWSCRCDCGVAFPVRQSDLRRRTRSCGCTGGRPIKQDDIDRGYPRAHARVRSARGPASDERCIDCPDWADAWSYVRGCPDEKQGPDKPHMPDSSVYPYCEHVQHYQPRCRTCHNRMDQAQKMTVRRMRAMMLNRM